MAYDSNEKLAGPIDIDPAAVERDAMIREDNDAARIDDSKVREYVKNNRDKIFGLQTSFFAELRRRLNKKS